MNQADPPIMLEVCVDSLASAKTAAEHGAQRIELNSALELGGLTPSISLARLTIEALKPTGCQVIAMVRPRPGGFCYSQDELDVMSHDIAQLIEAGVDGVALGVLTQDGQIDKRANENLIRPILDAGKQAVFHRAFDLTPDPIQALDSLVSLGFHRILTSGQAPTAPQGTPLLAQLNQHGSGRIDILPGSGITPANVEQLLRDTGCTQVHGTLRTPIEDTSGSNNPAIEFNGTPLQGGAYYQADPDKVKALMDALNPV